MMSEAEEKYQIPVAKLRDLLLQAGEIIRRRDTCQSIASEEKEGCANYVTEFDYRVQQFVKEGIRQIMPDCTFFAEENDGDTNRVGKMTVYLDPIDGTMNFMHGCRECSISLAVSVDGMTRYGAVYLPFLEEFYEAELGRGATCNGKPIHVSNRGADQALIIVGTASYYKGEIGRQVMEVTSELFFSAADIRRYGSAAAEMCFVACGRAEASFEYRLYPWDYAAGALIISEAGGYATAMDGTPLSMDCPGSMLCGNPVNYNRSLSICRSTGLSCLKINA